MNKFAKISLWLFSIIALVFIVIGLFHFINRGTTVYFSEDERYGFVDKNGKEVIKATFLKAEDFSEGLAAVMDENYQYGYIDKTGKMVIKPQFDGAIGFSEGLAGVRPDEDSQIGFIDKTGQIVIEPQFNSASSFSEGFACVCKHGQDQEKYGYVSKDGRIIIPQFDDVLSFSEGLAAVAIDDRYGYIDTTGQMVIQPQFVYVENFSEGLACVKREGDEYYGYIDKTGQMVIDPQFDDANSFSEGLAGVGKLNDDLEEPLYGYIDKTGQKVIDFDFDNAGKFSEGLAKVRVDDLYGFIDKTGQFVIAPQFSATENFSEGLASVQSDSLGGWVYIDKNGEVVLGKDLIDAGFRTNWNFHEGLGRVYKGSGCGLSNWLGIHLTKPIYDEIEELDNGLFAAMQGESYSLLNKRGKVLADHLDYVYSFTDELVEVIIDEKSGLVNRKGVMVVEPQYDEIYYYDEEYDRARVSKDGKYGYIDGKGQLVIELNYDEADFFYNDQALVEIDGESMYIDTDGNVVSETISEENALDRYLVEEDSVIYYEENTLDPTPIELKALVSGVNVDLRNSIWSILNQMPEYSLWGTNYFDKEEISGFIESNILQNMTEDPAIHNLYLGDYNDCIEHYGAIYLEENGNSCWDENKGWGQTWKHRFIEPLLASERLQDIFYTWVKPMLKHSFDECNMTQKMCIVNAVNHMIDYTSNYDHEAEKEFYQACVGFYGEWKFNASDIEYSREKKQIIDTEDNPYRPLETWVYRRVEEQSMSASQIHDWLLRIKKDLNMGGFQ